MTRSMHLPRPGVVGVLIRFVLGVVVVLVGVQTLRDTPSFWDGYSEPTGAIMPIVVLAWLTRSVINEMLQKSWGWRPTLVALGGLAITMAIGAWEGAVFGPPFGIYLWAWTLVVALLLGPAFLLASLLRTPGCEMLSFKHAWSKLRRGKAGFSPCPGFIDRFDSVRLLGKW